MLSDPIKKIIDDYSQGYLAGTSHHQTRLLLPHDFDVDRLTSQEIYCLFEVHNFSIRDEPAASDEDEKLAGRGYLFVPHHQPGYQIGEGDIIKNRELSHNERFITFDEFIGFDNKHLLYFLSSDMVDLINLPENEDYGREFQEAVGAAYIEYVEASSHNIVPEEDRAKPISFQFQVGEALLKAAFTTTKEPEILFDGMRMMARYNKPDMKTAKGIFFQELQNRGISLNKFLHTIPPSSELWQEIPITMDFLESLSLGKRRHFLKVTEQKLEITNAQLKQLLFPAMDTHTDEVKQLLFKFRGDFIAEAAELIDKDSDFFNFASSRFNSFSMGEIADFFKSLDGANSENLIYEFLTFISTKYSSQANKAFVEAIRSRIKERERRANRQ